MIHIGMAQPGQRRSHTKGTQSRNKSVKSSARLPPADFHQNRELPEALVEKDPSRAFPMVDSLR
jgi:hypothetical protein